MLCMEKGDSYHDRVHKTMLHHSLYVNTMAKWWEFFVITTNERAVLAMQAYLMLVMHLQDNVSHIVGTGWRLGK